MHFTDPLCTFIHVPKTGGTSIERALKTVCSQWGGEAHHYGWDEENQTWLQHLTLQQTKTHRYFRDLGFTFAFVRNPWDRLVSEYLWRHKNQKITFSQFVKRENTWGRSDFFCHMETQLSYLTWHGKIAVDFVGRYERLQQDWRHVCDQLEIKAKLPHDLNTKKKRKGKHYSEFYTPELREIVEDTYHDDIKEFGYEFDDTHPDSSPQ